MSVDRARVVAVILSVRDALRAERASAKAVLPDPRGEVLRRACAQHGVAPEAWKTALDADPELARLFDQAVEEAVVTAPDPGPYDAISRESPSGSAEADASAPERDARLLDPESR